MNPMGTAAGATLTGEAKLIYNALVPHLKDISDGKRSAAVISVGQTVGGIEPDGKVNLTKGMDSETYNHLIDALLMDLSYELYWINVTKGFFYVNRSSGSSYQVEFYFSVDTTYNNGVTVDIVSSPFYAYADTAKTGLAASAAANAKNVVAQFAGKNDYNKLLGYAQWISDQVTYDYDAVNNDAYTYDINPWQLIHAFDGDPNTNIVCEGYAKAFHYLCDLSAFQADTECYKVTGTLDGGGHMWNHVRMNGKYYLVDVTCYDQDGFYWDGMFMAGAPINEDGSYTIEEIPYAFYPETQALWGSTGVLDLAEESYDPSQECPGHVWNEGTVTYPPTCYYPGQMEYSCTICHITRTEEIPMADHDHTIVPRQEPTCTRPGYAESDECSMCGLVHSGGEEIPALGHSNELRNAKEPTCTEEGYTGDTFCIRCGSATGFGKSIPALGHDGVLTGAFDPTCTEEGYTGNHVCTRCGEITQTGESIPALGHNGVHSGEVAPSCEEPGNTGDYICSRCGEVTQEGSEIPALGHEGVVTGAFEPTCTQEGYTGDRICSRCGELTQAGEAIPALGHDPHWMDPQEPDCEQEGHTGREECARCGAVLGEGEVVPALGHTAALTTVPARAATDTQYGNEEFETWACSRCGAYVHEDGRPMSGEEFEELRLRYKTYAKAKSVVVTLENGEPIPASVNRADYPQGLTLKAQVLPFTAKQEVTWTSGAKTVATVNENGTVTFLKNGSVTITAAAGSVRGRASLKVVTWAAQITITGKADFLIPGKSLTLKAQVLPADTTNKKVIWSLSGPGAEVATITSAGTVKIPSKADLSQGPLELTVTATAQDGSEVYGTYSLILYPKVTSVTLTNFGQTIAPGSTLVLPMGAEDSIDLAAFVNPENALNSLTWKSSGTKTLQVDQQGKLTALKPGTVTITVTATDGSAKKATVKIKVVQLMEQLEIPDTLNLAGGKNVTFKPVIGPQNTTNKTLVYFLMNAPEGVTITKSGTLKTKPVTEPVTFAVYVEATDGSGAMDCCDVTLYPAATSVTLTDRLGNEITEKTIVLPVGQNLQLGSIVGPEKACDAVTWKTSSAKTATVSENGLVTPIKPGTITLTVTAADGTNRKDTVKIKVIQLMESLTIPGQLHLAGGKSYTFKPVIGPANTTTKGINWTLEAPVTGVTLSRSGVLRTKAVTEPVTVTVVATAKDGSGTTARCAVTIYPAATKVTLTQNGQPITVRTLTVVAGQQLDLDAIVSPEGAYEGVTWKSSSPTRASVDENGVVTVLKTGSVTITATAADGSAKKATIIIKVLPA